MDRSEELEAFKRLDLRVIASTYGFATDRKKTTRRTEMMSNGSEKIAISFNGSHYVFWSTGDHANNGSVIDFVQKIVEPGASLGRVRQVLRPFLGSVYMSDVKRKNAGKMAPSELKHSEPDLLGVAARYGNLVPIAGHNSYLCDRRGIPLDLVLGERLRGRIRLDPRRGSLAFPHWGCPSGTGSQERCLTGYEIKGASVNMFSKGGRKGLWMSRAFERDRVLAIGESGLDCLSYLALNGESGDVRIASISGQLNPHQPELISSAIYRMEEGSQIVAAFDNDPGGDKLTEQLIEILDSTGRKDLKFEDHRPVKRMQDWNKVLMDTLQSNNNRKMCFGR